MSDAIPASPESTGSGFEPRDHHRGQPQAQLGPDLRGQHSPEASESSDASGPDEARSADAASHDQTGEAPSARRRRRGSRGGRSRSRSVAAPDSDSATGAVAAAERARPARPGSTALGGAPSAGPPPAAPVGADGQLVSGAVVPDGIAVARPKIGDTRPAPGVPGPRPSSARAPLAGGRRPPGVAGGDDEAGAARGGRTGEADVRRRRRRGGRGAKGQTGA
jgi:ribonuclease E